MKLRRENANDGIEVVVQSHSSADDRPRTAEFLVPKGIADHRSFSKPIRSIAEIDQSAQLRTRVQDAEVIRTYGKKLQPFRAISAGQITGIPPHNGHRREDAGAITKIIELGNREADIPSAELAKVGT